MGQPATCDISSKPSSGQPSSELELLIVGAGPIGLELAVALKQAGVDYAQLDAGPIGQTISWYPHHARFFSSPERIAIAGVPLRTVDQTKATGEQYISYLHGVAQQFDLRVNTFERVRQIDRGQTTQAGESRFTVRSITRSGVERTYHARYVVLAIGDMHRPNRLGIEGEDLGHVSHYFVDPHYHFGRRLLIVGGANSAVESALRCKRAGASVSVSYRGGQFKPEVIKYWLLPEMRSLIESGKIAFYPHTTPVRITPEHVELAEVGSASSAARAVDSSSAELAQPANGQRQYVEADDVLLMSGYQQDNTLLRQAGVKLEGENQSPVVDPRTMQTDVPGIFVAGTAAAGTQHKFRLFIENAHPHVARITQAVTGQSPAFSLINEAGKNYAQPES